MYVRSTNNIHHNPIIIYAKVYSAIDTLHIIDIRHKDSNDCDISNQTVLIIDTSNDISDLIKNILCLLFLLILVISHAQLLFQPSYLFLKGFFWFRCLIILMLFCEKDVALRYELGQRNKRQ